MHQTSDSRGIRQSSLQESYFGVAEAETVADLEPLEKAQADIHAILR
jgi:hypothetical protein